MGVGGWRWGVGNPLPVGIELDGGDGGVGGKGAHDGGLGADGDGVQDPKGCIGRHASNSLHLVQIGYQRRLGLAGQRLESGDQVVILEGEVRQISAPPRALTEKVSQAYCAKYAESGYAPPPEQWDEGILYEMQPQTAFAWTKFPDDTTRWQFG